MADNDNELTPQEKRLIACAARGHRWMPEAEGEGKPDLDPVKAATWNANRTLRAAVIRCLASGETWPGKSAPWRVGPKGLQIDGARISGDLDLECITIDCRLGLWHCAFEGHINLRDAHTRTISFDASHWTLGCNANRLHVRGGLFLRNGFTANGAVILRGAKIEGQLACNKGSFENADGTALDADGITVGSAVFLCDGFTAKGEVKFVGAKIDGQLDCSKGSFENLGGIALNADAIAVGADVFLRSGFAAKGKVNFNRAFIGGSLRCKTASFHNPGGDALVLTLAEIGAGLFLTNLSRSGGPSGVEGRLVLDQATCRTYCDDDGSWPDAGKLVLDGFTYQRFHACATDWSTRLKWLQRQPDDHLKDRFHPQPWTQAAKVLREMGHDDDARELAMRREYARTQSREISWLQRRWLSFLHRTIGSGYKPQRALYWSAAFVLIGWAIFAAAGNLGFMAPRNGGVLTYLAEHQNKPIPQHYTSFNAFMYSLDTFLPVIELGQDVTWEPDIKSQGSVRTLAPDEGWFTCTKRLAAGQNYDWRILPAKNNRSCGFAADQSLAGMTASLIDWSFRHGFHRFINWTWEILGWMFISLFIAGMSGITKKD